MSNTATWDDYKDDYLPRLQKSYLYKRLAELSKESDPEILTLTHGAVHYAVQRTKTIIRHMNEYTLHDSDHLFRVLNLIAYFGDTVPGVSVDTVPLSACSKVLSFSY